ncbi:MAG: tRNA (N6-threonylcarbamoyladenosine(37)-N6)-methyltransferase TrmO [Dissulfurispiraceae bacterium]
MKKTRYLLRPVGAVISPLKSLKDCPKQGSEGAPDAWLEIDPVFSDALDGLVVGSEILVITWLHEARRDLLKVHPRGDPDKALRGVFATRSPDRPNPVGLHRVIILDISKSCRLRVGPLEALDGTPIIDIKSVLHESEEL